jgi:autotransporter adhesin
MRRIILGAFALLAATQTVVADPWQSVYDAMNLQRPNVLNGLPVNDGIIQFNPMNCPPDQLQQELRISFGGCTVGPQTFSLDLKAFARPGDLSALSEQMAATNAQLTLSLQKFTRESQQGIAQSLAMAGSPQLQADENYALSMNVGTFGGQTAFAAGAVARVDDHVSFNAGISGSLDGGSAGARAGIRFGW